MIALRGRCEMNWRGEPLVLRVADGSAFAQEQERQAEALRVAPGGLLTPGYAAYLLSSDAAAVVSDHHCVRLPSSLDHLEAGDVIRVVPNSGEVAVLYRRQSTANVIFTTERCNSDCVMCSQPPKDVDDRFLVDAFLAAIAFMDPQTPQLGISGGEPTLLGDDLLRLIASCRDHLPNTPLHMLSNGRLFNYLTLAERLAGVGHPDLTIGIPLYADTASRHDFIVQAGGAFEQTVRGIMNLKRCGVAVELRVVLHRLTVERLPQLCQFLARNLPMVDHVALMGLEPIGYVRMNHDALWIDPLDYQDELAAGVRILARAGPDVSIYNHQLCVLDEALWPYARKSISDWKTAYAGPCDACQRRDDCGGFFGHSAACRSRGIHALGPVTFDPVH